MSYQKPGYRVSVPADATVRHGASPAGGTPRGANRRPLRKDGRGPARPGAEPPYGAAPEPRPAGGADPRATRHGTEKTPVTGRLGAKITHVRAVRAAAGDTGFSREEICRYPVACGPSGQ
ncbi:hypothetical protein GCM10010140_73760 [Streptosporangium pseudovulgare]|uniref:Uncharacterized protein n=1 Tax=Streptosporangium pseudovulgare TaxID=35765 RepID=A0ABQ2RJH3_9ACTN|nr:hypothetical protein GCM10010140_73760 [Streptosporangium pseudovulgare]